MQQLCKSFRKWEGGLAGEALRHGPRRPPDRAYLASVACHWSSICCNVDISLALACPAATGDLAHGNQGKLLLAHLKLPNLKGHPALRLQSRRGRRMICPSRLLFRQEIAQGAFGHLTGQLQESLSSSDCGGSGRALGGFFQGSQVVRSHPIAKGDWKLMR